MSTPPRGAPATRPAVRVAVVPAAGLGTRLLPATLAVEKEFLPLGVHPALWATLLEAEAAGIEELVVVLSPGKERVRRFLSPESWLGYQGSDGAAAARVGAALGAALAVAGALRRAAAALRGAGRDRAGALGGGSALRGALPGPCRRRISGGCQRCWRPTHAAARWSSGFTRRRGCRRAGAEGSVGAGLSRRGRAGPGAAAHLEGGDGGGSAGAGGGSHHLRVHPHRLVHRGAGAGGAAGGDGRDAALAPG